MTEQSASGRNPEGRDLGLGGEAVARGPERDAPRKRPTLDAAWIAAEDECGGVFAAGALAATPPAPAQQQELWRHQKTGGVYERLMSAVNEADKAVLVVYRSVETGVRWVRPSKEFYDGRFIRVDETQHRAMLSAAPQAPTALTGATGEAVPVAWVGKQALAAMLGGSRLHCLVRRDQLTDDVPLYSAPNQGLDRLQVAQFLTRALQTRYQEGRAAVESEFWYLIDHERQT